MIILGLTGAIGMGKSTVAGMLRGLGIPVYDADAAIRAIYEFPEVDAAIKATFPTIVANGVIDRKKLADVIYADATKRKQLTDILYPHLPGQEKKFLKEAAAAAATIAVLEIPLLFETGADARVDAVIAVRAPAFMQRYRVMKRPGMTKARFEAIKATQLSSKEKCRRADKVIQTGISYGFTLRQLRGALNDLQRKLANGPLKWDSMPHA
jgi:dephospho-CoA kinase